MAKNKTCDVKDGSKNDWVPAAEVQPRIDGIRKNIARIKEGMVADGYIKD